MGEVVDGAVVRMRYNHAGQAVPTITADDDRGVKGHVLLSGGAGQQPYFGEYPFPPSGAADFQRFNTSGTWNKPDLSGNCRVLIRAWGAGGSGACGTGSEGGGGGGGYSERWMVLSELAVAEPVTVGAGGAGVSGSNSGNNGGNTFFDEHLSAWGGGGGVANVSGGAGGGAGQFGTQAALGTRGAPAIMAGSTTTFHGDPGQHGFWHGGGGSFGNVTGSRSFNGGGGGGGHDGNIPAAGGESVNGGRGGDAGANGNSGLSGSQPGGGGGAGENAGGAFSGPGGDGRVEVFVFASA